MVFPFFPELLVSVILSGGTWWYEYLVDSLFITFQSGFNAPSLHQVHQQRLQCRHQPSTTTTLSCFIHGGAAEAFKLVLHGTRLFTSKAWKRGKKTSEKIEKIGNAIKTPYERLQKSSNQIEFLLFSDYLRSKTHSQGTETIIDFNLQETSVHRLRCWHVSFWNAKEL